MNNFKIGDKIRFKKLLYEEFEEIYHKKHHSHWYYKDYLDICGNDFNKIYEIIKIECYVYCKDYKFPFYMEEIKKVSYLKTKFKIIKEVLNDR